MQYTSHATAEHQGSLWFWNEQHRQVNDLFAQLYVWNGRVQDGYTVGEERVLTFALHHGYVAVGRVLGVEQAVARPLLAGGQPLESQGQR